MTDTTRVATAFGEAVRLQRQGRHSECDALCTQVVQAEPRHFAAWHLKGLMALERGAVEEGISLIRRSLSINGDQPEAHSNVGNALLTCRKAGDALPCFEQALRLKPDFAAAHFNRGIALRELGHSREALECFERALELRPEDSRAWCERATTLCELDRAGEALASLDALLKRRPTFAGAQRGRGAALLALGRPAEALESYAEALRLAPRDSEAHYGRGNALFRLGRAADAVQAYDEALSLRRDFPEALNNRCSALRVLQRPAEALASCDEAVRLRPEYAAAHFSRGNVLQDLAHYREALESYDHALALRPAFADALTNAGAALSELGEHESALERFDAALSVDPHHVGALTNRTHTLGRLHRHAPAAEGLARLLELAPDQDAALGFLVNARLHCCDWREWSPSIAQVRERLAASKPVSRPLDLLAISDSAAEQLACARIAAAARKPPAPAALWHGERYGHARPRIAYVSGNFGRHPVAQLLAGVLEKHDPERVEAIGISLADDGSPLAQRIRAAFPRFIDASAMTDAEIAALLRRLEVDIAIDLHGYTEGLRKALFQSRAAPVQVNYLGYPGTLGSAFWDYLLADPVVIPEGEERWYAEQVVRLPHCYLPNDDRREVAPAPTRGEAGLPAEGLVLCAFTNPYKINPPLFDVWMRLLREVPGSVLWLRLWAAEPTANLLREAQRRGVPPERLVFADPVMDSAQHLGRQALADLFLDTTPYNAHSTACEALWAGVPVLTCAGGSFAGRVAASALHAARLPELVSTTLEDYERRALELSRDPARLAAIRSKVAAARSNSPLFDTEGYCRALERAFTSMWERAEQGEQPRGFAVGPPESRAPQRRREAPQPAARHPQAATLRARAAQHLQRGEPSQAEALLRELLQSDPRERDALHQLGVLCLQTERPGEGARWIGESLRVDPAQPGAHMHLGIALRRLGRLPEAIQSFDEALHLRPHLAEALYNRGNTLADLGRLEDAVTDLQRALEVKPDFIPALSRQSELLGTLCRFREAGERARQLVLLVPEDSPSADLLAYRGNALRDFGRAADALPSFDRALVLRPDSAALWNSRGIALRDLKRGPEALASFARALELDPEFAEALVNRGDALRDAGLLAEALRSYDEALRLKPALGEAHRGRGLALRALRRLPEALAEFEHAERLNASKLDLANQRGNALLDLSRFEEALGCYERALELRPDQPDLLWNRAMALRWLRRDAQAMECFARLNQVAPDYEYGASLLLHSRLELCDWRDYTAVRERILSGVKPGARIVQPFTLLSLSDSAAAQLECARSFAPTTTGGPVLAPAPRYGHRRIRVAYVSGDLREHAVSYLMAGVFEKHDRTRFEIIGLSLRPEEDSTMGRRLRGAFDRLIDVSGQPDAAVNALVRELEVDIAVDLVGHTEYRRREVFSERPAPVQVSYLGYPGTLGMESMDYILADPFVVPAHLASCYAEKVVYLPQCFQANDDQRVVAATPTRASVRLPETALVFCCFNANAKLNPAMFDVWCRLLQAVPGSLLWMVARSGEVCANLQREMTLRGVDPRRLVFADMLTYPHHLARIALADLFLDTFPFSAGATASDALWAGVPILTCVGEAFASRMAGSLLHSLGLAELIATNLADYEQRALELAHEPERLAQLRRRLGASRATAAAFDTARFCRGLEQAYIRMCERAASGEPPQAFTVS
jgi:predicted O-linked N-acetylglucosamine transferase (SPINDLY family)